MMASKLPFNGIRCRAPLRLGLAGGGTDVSPYSEEFGGEVLNATIDRYAFATIESSHDWRIRFRAADLNIEESFPLDLHALADAKLKLHAGVYLRMVSEFGEGRPLAVTVQSTVDAPAGSGLGSSSALVVALVEAFRAILNVPLGPYEIAKLAHDIERTDIGLAGGKQDHYAATFGGLNYIEFLPGGRVIVNPLRLSRSILLEFESSLVSCFSGISRNSADIIMQQKEGMIEGSQKTVDSLHALKRSAADMKDALLRGNIVKLAEILNESWAAKQATATGISNGRIDELFKLARQNGAIGGKVSGAGGGGFMMFLVPPANRTELINALNGSGALAAGVEFTSESVESWLIP